VDSIKNEIGVIILAAGKGTRMKSDKAKVLHEILERPMISYVAETAVNIANENVIVVVGHQAENVRKVVEKDYKIAFAIQSEQLGTGHAVMCALPYLNNNVKCVVVLCGDVPLISCKTIENLIQKHKDEKCDISLLAVEIENPAGYGRIILDVHGKVSNIVEEADATPEQKKIKVINAGIYCIDTECLKLLLKDILPNNAQGEYYLTDIIEVGNLQNKKIGLSISKEQDEIIGINDVKALQVVENIMRERSGKIS